MKWYQKLGILGLLSVAGLSLAACHKSSSDSNTGKVTIEYFNQKKEMDSTLREIIKDFEKENPDIHVKMTSVPAAGTVLKTRILS